MRSYVRFVVLCCSVVSLWCILPITASTSETNFTNQPSAGYGFEVLMAKLDYIQYKLLAMELGLKERDEEAAASKAHLERVIGSLVGAVSRLDQEVGYNFTAIQADSWKILSQQTACANHEQMRKEILELVPKHGLSKGAQLLLAMEGFHRKEPFQSCKEAPAKESGVVSIQLSDKAEPFEAYCEQKAFGGGWLVIQYRFDGSLDFFRNWTEYRDGFGSVYQEFWIGLERLHQLTSHRPHELMVEIKDYDGAYRFAHYQVFEVGSEAEKHPLKKLGTYNGTGGDSLRYHEGKKFTTKDQDNDENGSNCATIYEGAWWYGAGYHSNLNGRYLNKDDTKSMNWYFYKNKHQGLAYSRMMIREV